MDKFDPPCLQSRDCQYINDRQYLKYCQNLKRFQKYNYIRVVLPVTGFKQSQVGQLSPPVLYPKSHFTAQEKLGRHVKDDWVTVVCISTVNLVSVRKLKKLKMVEDCTS